ncbi:MAG: zinc metalloprotease HtpX [Chloroflexi bacterium]|nr:MAG: zinc metalloprotease HtpX [Chloroflexota bacterium]
MAATTFYAQAAANRRKSALLLFVAALLFLGFGFVVGFAWLGDPIAAVGTTIFAGVAALVSGLVTYYGGAKMVLAASQARPATAEAHPVLMNVVQEMAIAADLPMPSVYVIEDTALNAFATGRSPQHASIAVTTGLLDRLDREELQGVIGHELGHVRNLDIRFALLVGVLVGGIALLADVLLRSMMWGGGRRRSNRDTGGGGLQALMMVLALVLAVLAPIAARLVQLSVSRQREYLADATAVEFTRNPAGLEGALWKIGTDREVLEVANRATQHLYIANPIKKFEKRANSLFSTHPPLADRINRLRALHGGAPLTTEDMRPLAAME